MAEKEKIKTLLVCFTSITFPEFSTGDVENSPSLSSQIPILAHHLTATFKRLGMKAEEVKIPARRSNPLDLFRAHLIWRLLDLRETNGLKIDRVICLDFPAWSANHPRKICLVPEIPGFLSLSPNHFKEIIPNIDNLNNPSGSAEQKRFQIQERKSLNEASRIIATTRNLHQEIIRHNFKSDFLPLPENFLSTFKPSNWDSFAVNILAKNGPF